jgi:hypothetical protein
VSGSGQGLMKVLADEARFDVGKRSIERSDVG